MEFIGIVTAVQIQVAPLKRNEGGVQVYDPVNLRSVPAIRLSADGVVGLIDGRELLDRHHRSHPQSGRREANGLSFNFSSHYAAIHARFGSAAALGKGGENIVIRGERQYKLEDLAAGVTIVTMSGQHIPIGELGYITPCVPFSNYVNGVQKGSDPALIKETLRFLVGGPRGFYGESIGEPAVVRPGDRVYRRLPAP